MNHSSIYRMNNKKEQKKVISNPGKKNVVLQKSERRFYLTALFSIIVATFIIYLPILGNHFTNWDDNSYIQNNPLIRSVNLKQIFSNNLMGNYHPLTVLVYSIEFHFFNLN